MYKSRNCKQDEPKDTLDTLPLRILDTFKLRLNDDDTYINTTQSKITHYSAMNKES